MDDLISRQAALNVFRDWVDKRGYIHEACEAAEYEAIENLPSARPTSDDLQSAYFEGYAAAESKYRKIMDALAREDLIILRRDAIEALRNCKPIETDTDATLIDKSEAMTEITLLPSVKP